MLSYRSVLVLCAAQLLAESARAQDGSPHGGVSAPLASSSEEPPPLEGGPATPPSDAKLPPAVAPAPSAEPAPCPPVPLPSPAAGDANPPPSPLASQDHEAVFRAFAVFAKSERDLRIVGTVAGVSAGLTTIALGALIAEPTGTDADVWYVIGGVTAGLSLLGLVMPSPAESLARSFRAYEPTHSASEARSLEIRWNDLALAAKRRRITGGAVSVVVSLVFVGSGIAIATGAGDFSDDDRLFWGTFLVATGATVGVSAAANLFVKSPAERSLEAYRAVRPEPVALVPLLVAGPGGVLVGAQGTF